MSAIFLSYRRDDSSGYAGRLFDNLAERFGRERVFMDIETLEPGMDFVAGIDRAIDSCGAVIALIGPNWISAQDGEGRRRLDDPHDFIRLEITSALKRNVRVIPVLVHNASMPLERELPEPLRPLCRLQATEISDNRWEFDVRRLADVLEPLVEEPAQSAMAATSAATAPAGLTQTTTGTEQKPGGRPAAWLAAAAAVILIVAGGGWWLSQSTPPERAQPPADEPVPISPPPAIPSEPVATTDPPPEPISATAPAAAQAPVATTEPPRPETPKPDEPLREDLRDMREAAETERVTVPGPRGPSPEELRQREITELLHAAEIDLAELRLTRPADNNAFERFQRVLELDPQNPTAREGLIAITERYHGLVEDALAGGALDRAQRYLDAVRVVDAGADWLTPMQREIEERRRQLATRPVHRPESAPRPAEADREACMSTCERDHQACRAEIGRQAEADCLSSRAAVCEERYQACMSDVSKMFGGQVALESECAGVHMRCTRSADEDCAAAPQIAEERCETQFDTCTRRCGSAP